MKIAIVASDYFPTVGGVQTAVHNIAHHLKRLGHSVIIISALPPGKVPARELLDGVWVYRLPWGRRPLWSLPFRATVTLIGLWRILRAFAPDIVYLNFLSINALYVLLLHYVWRFKLVTSARGNDIQGIPHRSRLQRWMLPRLFARADAAIFCSIYVEHDAAPFLQRVSPRAFVGVVADGFDPAEFSTPRAYTHPAPYVLAVGRLVHKKGFDLLIHAFATIAAEFPHVHLLIAGDGEERAPLERLITEHDLRARVHLLGFADRAKTLALFWGCEFFVLSSRLEPFGIVVLEAMAAHKAVLATKSGGVNELVQPGINGWLVDIDAPALANGMRAMLANADATRALGERAPHTIQNRTWASVTEELLAVFENALSHIQP